MHLIEKGMLFTELTIEESATVSGGGDCSEYPAGSNSSSNANATATVNVVINNPGSISNPSTPSPTPVVPPKLLPVLDAVNNYAVINI